MIESISTSYPFCENWEKKHCKSVIEEAYQWGEQLKKKNIKQKINTRINMMRFYNGTKQDINGNCKVTKS